MALSKRSIKNLEMADERLVRLFTKVNEKFPCEVIESHRNEEKQNEMFSKKLSKVKWPNSKHNKKPSQALDVCPLPIDWNDKNQFILFAGYVLGIASEMGIKIRWGGDFNRNFKINDESFLDMPHFELDE